MKRCFIFQSTQPEWAATCSSLPTARFMTISIHAARMGCDAIGLSDYYGADISIHAARMGCDLCFVCGWNIILFTISIHAARMGCDKYTGDLPEEHRISIHAARMGCDRPSLCQVYSLLFQSTQPEWAATYADLVADNRLAISIHAARMGCDKNII